MTRNRLTMLLLVPLLIAGTVAVTLAQRYGRYGRGPRSNRPAPPPEWSIDPRFEPDVFRFVRIQYDGGGGRGGGGGRWGRYGDRWDTDFPDAEDNFSYRLQQLTSLKVNPRPIYLRLTNPELFNYPFIYIVEPGDLMFSEEEVAALRKYLLGGGFLMVDDFWGGYQWDNWEFEINRVFPNRDPVELPLSHEIFHCVFDLQEKPQIPNVGLGTQSLIPGSPNYGITWEQPDDRDPHYRGLFDDDGRLMAIFCHNTDLGDGWEREGDNELYFREFSEKSAYPLGINIVFYAMTH